MTMNPFSLKKSDMLISLALLSPCVLAANNNIDTQPLSFNYSRQDNSADPRLALQSRGCHSKSDPLEIRIKLDNTTLDRDRRLVISVEGHGYLRNYTAFQPANGTVKIGKTNISNSFYIPWQVSVTENIGAVYIPWGRITSIVKFGPAHRFCFSGDVATFDSTKWINTHGYVPIFEESPGESSKEGPFFADKSLFNKYCAGKRYLRGPDFYIWPDVLTGGHQWYIEDAYTKNGGKMGLGILLNAMFFKQGVDKTIITEKGTDYETSRKQPLNFGRTNYIVGGEPDFIYRIPDDIPKLDDVVTNVVPRLDIKKGEWVLRTSNRNITAITLTIEECKKTYTCVIPKDRTDLTEDEKELKAKIEKEAKAKDENEDDGFMPVMKFKWQANPTKDAFNNVLYLTERITSSAEKPGMRFLPSTSEKSNLAGESKPADDPGWFNDDMYQTQNFYAGVPDMFRGTLVTGSSLNNKYEEYMRSHTPLSKPASAEGAINLANTDSLSFTIYKPAFTGSTWSISLTGKPLEFAPLFKHNKIALTAMEVRNACY